MSLVNPRAVGKLSGSLAILWADLHLILGSRPNDNHVKRTT